MGVWIETMIVITVRKWPTVTPCMGVWIETFISMEKKVVRLSHTLYGCVD